MGDLAIQVERVVASIVDCEGRTVFVRRDAVARVRV
jgi:hypothetical protein